jgi:PAS domain S-box-containing protein
VPRRKVLIVGDEIVVAGQLDHSLTRFGYEVTAIVASVEEALELATRTAPDLVLIDLPSCGDISPATRGELQGNGDTPALLTIADTDEAGLEWALAAGQPGHIVKPFTERELRATIELALCRHDAARAVHEVEDRFFAVSIDMLCHLDFNGHFRRLNPAWERTLGFTRQELMARPFIEFVHPDDRERTLKQNREVRGGGQALSFENRYLCKDGSYRWFRWNAAPDFAEQVIYSVARDVTASRQAEEDRERLVGELQSALAEVKVLREILPLCSYCKKIRDDENYWHTVEHYIAQHTKTRFSHGICPSCMASEVEPELRKLERD